MDAVLPSWPTPLGAITLKGTLVLLEVRTDHETELIAISQDKIRSMWLVLEPRIDFRIAI